MTCGWYIEAGSTNPYENLALEEYLLNYCEKTGDAVLYIWQNENTVVVGRNQNVYTECNIEYIKAHNVSVARRLTGGGAVYHDLGNLNYTIIVSKQAYDISRSTRLILNALKKVGINASNNGRNDICIGEKKISGNAYYTDEKVGMHHGTILFRVDVDKMDAVLSVSAKKLSKHGIVSVKSRVGDVYSEYPDITIMDIKGAIRESFCEEYGFDGLRHMTIPQSDLYLYMEKYSSDAWNFGKIQEYNAFIEDVFEWGTVRISLTCVGEQIRGVEIATDSLEVEIIETLKNELNNSILGWDKKNLHQVFRKFSEKHKSYRKLICDIEELFIRLC